MPRDKRGAALLVVMLAGIVLLTMLQSLVSLASSRAFASRQHYQRAAALFLVQSAIARVQNELAKDASWCDGYAKGELESTPGTFQVVFDSDDSGCEAHESVNNLSGAGAADGPRGPGSVPPYTVDLVVTARADGFERRVEVLLGRTVSRIDPFALSASNRIHLKGAVEVGGTKSLASAEPMAAGLHSNVADPGTLDAVKWTPVKPGDRAVVSGTVSSSSTSTSSIDFGADPSAYSVGGFERGAAGKSIPGLDIGAEIAANSSHPDPDVATGGKLGPGKYSVNGDLTVSGDLELEDASLYVSGKLTVNGSVSGTGGVFTGGDTSLQGDSKVITSNAQGVALYSKGSVTLTGFKGSEFLDALAGSDPQAAQLLTDTKTVMTALEQAAQTMVPEEMKKEDFQLLNSFDHSLGEQTNAGGDTDVPYMGLGQNLLGQLAERIQAQPPGPTRDFMVKRVTELRQVMDDDAVAGSGGNIKNRWRDGELAPGIWDNVMETEDSSLVGEMFTLALQNRYDKLGTSYFQGVILTNGYLYASNEVSILGAVWAKDDGSQSAGTTPEGDSIAPGDIFLSNGARLTFVEDYVKNAGGPSVSKGCPQVKSWLE